MCGITGWVSYDRDLTTERGTLAAMAKTMVCRGPDADGVWLDTHAGLGHRRLAVIDINGGKQPMAAERDGRTVLVTTYSGEVYNHRELRAELAGLGHSFRTGSDTEVVLHAYLEWGADFVERLNGMYAFALWDPREQELLLVRDRMGVKPLYYYPTADGVLFGSEPKAILAHPSVRAAVDTDGLAELLALTKTPGHAIYQGMKEVVAGHVVRVRREGLTTRRYWALEAREHTDDTGTTVARVRELLDDIITRQLDADVPLCTLLSGGLDSSAITALAQRGRARKGAGPVRSFAVDFVGQSRNFTADWLRGTPDAPYARALAEHVGSDHRDIVLDTAALMNRADRDAVLNARDLPTGFGEGDVSLYLLFKAVRESSTVALSGEAADELFGGYRWFHSPEQVRSHSFPWLSPVGPRGAGADVRRSPREAMLDGGLLTKLDLPGYRAARYREALTEVPRLDGETGLERRMREICHLHLTRFVQFPLERTDRVSMATGLEVRVPFCDHRLVQYVFNTPWKMKAFDGREKSLLRAATRDLLPEEVADRVKSPYPSIQDPRYDEALRSELRTTLADPEAPVRALLDTDAAQRVIESASGVELRIGSEFVLNLDGWLRRYDISLEI
ncbi:asparagine synthase (glutamine-hydrolyzing) [Streptomyces sp. H27-C3]|uniref:asparagine synthase (glutamine-hydrolyzing) n=1 Tax=Streptomyces sp. H27-C3 TaxID=3046305 RepID=UPI0024B946D1|nr:asparagine synthase (glutamine-hydrolyzing) [Streptomyces sp. H27-C3]MDJ0466237.1 asparagine synthase (glutamine-hydrolyzing) [Streptomyces sp. H27-C3]